MDAGCDGLQLGAATYRFREERVLSLEKETVLGFAAGVALRARQVVEPYPRSLNASGRSCPNG
ncbi:hypothetical protein KCMC57_up62410 [Kitasatospora sp. CMC57]|uniref:Uncharacterized protein n=1 Tax=Kitasatospora sp. CMC57 TaxID=3231513 RepID=A0AB33K862_9ACTN